MKRLFIACASMSLLAIGSAAVAQDMPAEYKEVLSSLGKQGEYKATVLKVNIPRNDLSMVA